jgi:putative membrane protein
MNLLKKEFRDKIGEFVGKIEKQSGVEVVVAITAKSGNYSYIGLIAGILFCFAALGLTVFSEEEWDDEFILLFPLIGFAIGYLLFSISSFASFFVPKKVLKRNVEIYGRAAFQKGKIYETASRQGILIFISLFEKEIIVLEDKVVSKRIPFDKISEFKNNFNAVFRKFPDGKASERILSSFESMIPICAKYIPIEANDINEIPDDLEIVL